MSACSCTNLSILLADFPFNMTLYGFFHDFFQNCNKMAFRGLPRLLCLQAPWRLKSSPVVIYNQHRAYTLVRQLERHHSVPALLIPGGSHALQQYRYRNVYEGYASRHGKPLSRKTKLYFFYLGGSLWLLMMTPL